MLFRSQLLQQGFSFLSGLARTLSSPEATQRLVDSIVELKYAKYKDPESRVEELRLEGITQANRYAETETVKNAVDATQLHKIVEVYKGMDMPVCEEI